MAWLGLAWLGLAWLGLAWLGLAWLGLAWLGALLSHCLKFQAVIFIRSNLLINSQVVWFGSTGVNQRVHICHIPQAYGKARAGPCGQQKTRSARAIRVHSAQGSLLYCSNVGCEAAALLEGITMVRWSSDWNIHTVRPTVMMNNGMVRMSETLFHICEREISSP